MAPARRLDSVTWLEGKGSVRGHVQSFWGDGAALLLVCPGEGLSEPGEHRPRIIRCLVPHHKGVSFSLAGKLRENVGEDIASGAFRTCWLGEEHETLYLARFGWGIISGGTDHHL